MSSVPLESTPDLRTRAVQGVAWSAIQVWGGQVASFAVFAVLSRLLAPEAFGLLAMASLVIAFAQVLLDAGLSDALVQREATDDLHWDTVFWVQLGLGALLMLVAMAAAPGLARAFRADGLTPIIRALSVSFVLGPLGAVHAARLRRELAFRTIAIATLSGAVAGGALGVGLAIRGAGVWSLVWHQVVGTAGTAVLLWGGSSYRPRRRLSWRHARSLLAFGAHVVASNLVNFANRRIDDLLVGLFLGPVALGLYELAYRVLMIGLQAVAGISTTVALPVFSRMQGNPVMLRAAFLSATRLTAAISFPAFLGLALLAPELVGVLFGAQWGASVPVLRALALVGVVHSIFYFNGPAVAAVGRPAWTFRLVLAATLLDVAIFLAVIEHGIAAIALGYLVRTYAFIPVHLWVLHRAIGLPTAAYTRQFGAVLLACAPLVIVVRSIQLLLGDRVGPAAILALAIPFGMLAYGLALRWRAPELLAVARRVLVRAQPAPTAQDAL